MRPLRSTRLVARRLRRRIEAEQWVVGVLRQRPRTQQLRRMLEQQRVQRMVRAVGSADAALDRIVAEAVGDAQKGDR